MENLQEKLIVSRETLSELQLYQSMLVDWQNKVNLVSKNSLSCAWERHFLDSAQLYKYIPVTAGKIIDFGSGAGFPALVLAIMSKKRTPYLNFVAVESITKKTVFLKEVCSRLQLKVRIENQRIESLPTEKFDVITSRAMCSLDKLLGYSLRFCQQNTICIFPKGKTFEEEILEAKKNYRFNCQIEQNLLSDEGKILIITDIKSLRREKYA